MARCRQQLEDSQRLHQFVHDVDDELGWVREREPLASNSDLGNNLTSVQNLLKKHQVMSGFVLSCLFVDCFCLFLFFCFV